MEPKRIVVIDDEEDLCTLIQGILEATGQYFVNVAHNGTEGKVLCLRKSPDLIFLDYVMPQEKGDAVIRFLNAYEATKRIPIILMSGLGEMVYFKKNERWKWLPNREVVRGRGEVPGFLKWEKAPERIAQEFGVAAYLPKPFPKETLLHVTQSVLSKEDVDEMD